MTDEHELLNQNPRALPPTTIHIEEHDHWFHATSNDWPDLHGNGNDPGEAVNHLINLIQGNRPLSPEVTLYLTQTGGPTLLAEWDRLVRGPGYAPKRLNRKSAQSTLRAFRAHGFNAIEACDWIAAHAQPDQARTARDNGLSAKDFDDYLDTYWTWNHEDLSWKDQMSIQGPIAWIEAGIRVRRALAYESHHISIEDARDNWEPHLRQIFLSQEALSELLKTGKPPQPTTPHTTTGPAD